MGKIKLGPIVFTSFWASLLSTNWQSTSLLWPLCRGGGSQFYVRPCLKVTFTASVLHQSREQRNKESPWGGCKNAISRIINCLICSFKCIYISSSTSLILSWAHPYSCLNIYSSFSTFLQKFHLAATAFPAQLTSHYIFLWMLNPPCLNLR